MLRPLKILCLALVCFAVIALPPQRAQSAALFICPVCWVLSLIPACYFPPGEKTMLYMKCPNVCGTREICVFDVNRYIVNKAKEITLEEQRKADKAKSDAEKQQQKGWGEAVKLFPSPPEDVGLQKMLKNPDCALNLGCNAKQRELAQQGPNTDLIDTNSCLRSIEEVSKSEEIVPVCGKDRTTETFKQCVNEYVIGTALLYGYHDPKGRGSAKSQYSPAETTRRDWCLKAVLRQQNMNCATASLTYLANIPTYLEHIKQVMSEIIRNSMKPCIAPDTPIKDNPAILPGCVRQDLVNLNALKQTRFALQQTTQALQTACGPISTFEELLKQDASRAY